MKMTLISSSVTSVDLVTTVSKIFIVTSPSAVMLVILLLEYFGFEYVLFVSFTTNN